MKIILRLTYCLLYCLTEVLGLFAIIMIPFCIIIEGLYYIVSGKKNLMVHLADLMIDIGHKYEEKINQIDKVSYYGNYFT